MCLICYHFFLLEAPDTSVYRSWTQLKRAICVKFITPRLLCHWQRAHKESPLSHLVVQWGLWTFLLLFVWFISLIVQKLARDCNPPALTSHSEKNKLLLHKKLSYALIIAEEHIPIHSITKMRNMAFTKKTSIFHMYGCVTALLFNITLNKTLFILLQRLSLCIYYQLIFTVHLLKSRAFKKDNESMHKNTECSTKLY